MSRSAYEIAQSALDDLYQVQHAFKELNDMFGVMLDHFQKDSEAHICAQIGIATVEGWSEKFHRWTEIIDDDLDGVKREAEAHGKMCARLLASRDAAKAIGQQP